MHEDGRRIAGGAATQAAAQAEVDDALALGGAQVLTIILYPAVLFMASMFFTSIYFTFRDSFSADEVEEKAPDAIE